MFLAGNLHTINYGFIPCLLFLPRLRVAYFQLIAVPHMEFNFDFKELINSTFQCFTVG